MVSFPYHSHIFRDSYGSGMGIVWEAYHKGVPSLGVPENPTEKWISCRMLGISQHLHCVLVIVRLHVFGSFCL